MIEARALSSDDWRLWRELRLAALEEAPAAFGSTLAEWSGTADTDRRWRTRLDGVALNLVLSTDGVPAGMVSATAPRDRQIELISLWVSPGVRGQEVGDEAIRQVLAWARREHPGSRVALSVKVENDHAIRLYARHGSVDVGPSPDDPEERLMCRPVSVDGCR